MLLFAHGEADPSGGAFPPWEAHPATVHFPIAFLVGAVGLDLYAWWRGRTDLARIATGLMAAGVLAGVVAAASGVVAFFTVPAHTGEAHRLMYWHLGLMAGAVTVFTATAVARRRNAPPPVWARAAGLLGVSVLLAGAYLGGRLVYRGGAGVDPGILAPEVRGGHGHGEEPRGSQPDRDDPHKGH
jgi:uncharacterized membrane protein